jgi:hypothetical protein
MIYGIEIGEIVWSLSGGLTGPDIGRKVALPSAEMRPVVVIVNRGRDMPKKRVRRSNVNWLDSTRLMLRGRK